MAPTWVTVSPSLNSIDGHNVSILMEPIKKKVRCEPFFNTEMSSQATIWSISLRKMAATPF